MSYYGNNGGGDGHGYGGRGGDRGGYGNKGPEFGRRGGNRDGGPGGRGSDRGFGGGRRGGYQAHTISAKPYDEREEPTRFPVMTNFFPFKFLKDVKNMELLQYHVKIISMTKEFTKDEAGEVILGENGKKEFTLVPNESSNLFANREGEWPQGLSSDLTRRILLQCQKKLLEEKKFIYTDGTSIVFSLSPLYNEDDLKISPPPSKKAKPDSYYGPKDDSGTGDPEDLEVTVLNKFWDYDVKIYDDDDQNFSRKKRFVVRFFEPKKLVFSTCTTEQKLLVDAANRLQIINFLNIGIKNSMMKSMRTFDKTADLMYPGLESQEILMSEFGRHRSVTPWVTPVTALRESAHIIGNNELYLMANYCMRWANRKCRILQNLNGRLSILGVDIPNGNAPIPPDKFEQIKREFKTARFHVRYLKGEKWATDRKNVDNWPDEKIERYKYFSKNGTVMLFRGRDNEENIRLTAHDHTFPVNIYENGEKIPTDVNVATYYEKIQGIKLEYPNLPIVRISMTEWFPIEFLWQAFGSKRLMNSAENIDLALKFNEQFAGSNRINHIKTLIHTPEKIDVERLSDLVQSRDQQEEFFGKLHLRVEKEPYTIQARRLKYPNLLLRDEMSEEKCIEGKEGQWSTNQMKFEKPAALTSFAVVDCTNKVMKLHDIFPRLFAVCENHGLSVPSSSEHILGNVTTGCEINSSTAGPDREALKRAIRCAIGMAKDEFIRDTHGRFRSRRMYFQSYFENEGTLYRCLVDPHSNFSKDDSLVVYLSSEEGTFTPTHTVEYDGNICQARLMCGVDDEKSKLNDNVLDFFNVVDNGKCYTAFNNGKSIGTFQNFARVYDVETPSCVETVHESIVRVLSPCHAVNTEIISIECPSMVFIIVPNTNARTYSMAKELCRVDFKVQSQVIVNERYCSQKNKDMYCSGVALKINTKLANTCNAVRAWKIEGHKWLQESPTLVIGYAMASGVGQDNKLAVAAAAIIDTEGLFTSEDFGVQKKNPFVQSEVMSSIMKTITLDFLRFNKKVPTRVILYRQGGQDGVFKDILTVELEALREGIVMAVREFQGNDTFSFPLISIFVAQSHHGIHIVPTGHGKGNVPSGTCVDFSAHGLSALNLSDNEELKTPHVSDEDAKPFPNAAIKDSYMDFHLIPHRGLKGTSKPVYYKCIWNENYLFRKEATASQLTPDAAKNLTFGLSFQYGTASKATRSISVLHYAERMANAALGYCEIIERAGTEGSPGNTLLKSFRDVVSDNPTSYHMHHSA